MKPIATSGSKELLDFLRSKKSSYLGTDTSGFYYIENDEVKYARDSEGLRVVSLEEFKRTYSVDRPAYYHKHPSGHSCDDVAQFMTFRSGNVLKYLWRCAHKHESPVEDLQKAASYLEKEIESYKTADAKHKIFFNPSPVDRTDVLKEFPYCIGVAMFHIWDAGAQGAAKSKQNAISLKKALVMIETELTKY